MKKKIIIGVSAALIVIAAIAAGVITGVSSKKKSSNDINVSCKAVVTKNDDITCYDWLKKLCNKTGVEAEDYRKAAKENGYITDSDEFSNDDIASGGFMALASLSFCLSFSDCSLYVHSSTNCFVPSENLS